MRKSLLFSVAAGLISYPDAHAISVAKNANLTVTAFEFSDRIFQSTVQGKILGPSGPIAGATVTLAGTKNSTMTDAEGNFKIIAPIGATLHISIIGFRSMDVKITANTLAATLETNESTLDEVVIVGYGSQKKSNLTGAVSTVNVEKVLGSRPIPDAARGLQGTIPGLSIVVPSGEVGSDPIMKIRGQIASINGSSNPLILVDNVEIPSINLINPNDIESVTVLKDAASSSIYGAKAAFGVVLITTKKGASTDSNVVTYSNNLSLQSPFKPIEIAGIDGLEYTLEAHENMKASGPAGGFWRVNRESFERVKEWQQKYGGTVGNYDPVLYGRDWYYESGEKYGLRLYDPAAVMIKDNAFSQIHNLSLNGKSNKTTYNLSAGYLGQQGMMKPAPHDDYSRFNATLNVSTKVSEFLTVRGGAMYADGTKRYPNSATGFTSDPWLYLYRWSRLFPIAAQQDGVDVRDPYFDTKNAHDAFKINRYLNLNLGSTLNVTKNWDIQLDYAYSTQNNTDNLRCLPPRAHGIGMRR